MSAVAEEYGKETNLERASALFFWLVFLLGDSQGLKRNCSVKSHLCPCPLYGTQKLTRKRCQAMEVSISTLGEKNSSCYFLLRNLGAPSSNTSPLRLTICCFWTCSKTLLLIRTVEKLVVRQPCSLDTLKCPKTAWCQPGDVTGVRSQWPAQGAPVAVPHCVWGCHSQEDFMEMMLMGHPFTLEQSVKCHLLLPCLYNLVP